MDISERVNPQEHFALLRPSSRNDDLGPGRLRWKLRAPNAPHRSTTLFPSRALSLFWRQHPGLLRSLLRSRATARNDPRLHSTRRIPLAFGGTSSYAFARTRRQNPFFSHSISVRVSLPLSRRVLRSVSLTLGELPSSLLHLPRHRSHATPNYPDVTGAARRLLQG